MIGYNNEREHIQADFKIVVVVNLLVLNGYAQRKTFTNLLLPSGAAPGGSWL